MPFAPTRLAKVLKSDNPTCWWGQIPGKTPAWLQKVAVLWLWKGFLSLSLGILAVVTHSGETLKQVHWKSFWGGNVATEWRPWVALTGKSQWPRRFSHTEHNAMAKMGGGAKAGAQTWDGTFEVKLKWGHCAKYIWMVTCGKLKYISVRNISISSLFHLDCFGMEYLKLSICPWKG